MGDQAKIHSVRIESLLTITGYQITTIGVFTTVTSDPIGHTDDIVSDWIRKHLRLDRDAAVGLLLFAAGALYGVYLLMEWTASGFTKHPFVTQDSFTAIAVGLQTLFSLSFMSAIAER